MLSRIRTGGSTIVYDATKISHNIVHRIAGSGEGKIAFLMLTIDDHNHGDVWDKWLQPHLGTKASLYVHPKFPNKVTQELLKKYVIDELVETKYPFILNAYIALYRAALKDPSNQRFILITDSCIPVKGFHDIYQEAFKDNCSLVEWWALQSNDVDTRFFPVKDKVDMASIHKHSAYACLTREHVELLVNAPTFLVTVPSGDEHYLSPLFGKNTKHRMITWSNWHFAATSYWKELNILANMYKRKKPKGHIQSQKTKMWNSLSHPETFTRVDATLLATVKQFDPWFCRKFAKECDVGSLVRF